MRVVEGIIFPNYCLPISYQFIEKNNCQFLASHWKLLFEKKSAYSKIF
jgi:hypothetical protein